MKKQKKQFNPCIITNAHKESIMTTKTATLSNPKSNLLKIVLFAIIVIAFMLTAGCGGGGAGAKDENTSCPPGRHWDGNQCALDPTPTDTSPPVVTITAPAASATVSGKTVTLSATATDNESSVSHVDFAVGTTAVCSATGSPFSCTWDSTTVSNGNYDIFVTAADTKGNVSLPKKVTVTVNNSGSTATLVTPTNIWWGIFVNTADNSRRDLAVNWTSLSTGDNNFEVEFGLQTTQAWNPDYTDYKTYTAATKTNPQMAVERSLAVGDMRWFRVRECAGTTCSPWSTFRGPVTIR